MSERQIAEYVSVRLDDLRLLLNEAEPLLVSKDTANRPVVSAIDRLGDEVCKATVRAQNDRSGAADA